MEKRWYRGNLVKAILIAMEHILALVVALSVVFLGLQVSMGNSPLEAGKKYTETAGYARELYATTTEILQGVSYEEYLKIENEDGSPRVIDLEEVYQGTPVTFTDVSGLTYRVEDLIEWSKNISAYTSGYENTAGSIIVCQKPDGSFRYYEYYDFMKNIASGKWSFRMDDHNLTASQVEENIRQIDRDLSEGNLGEGMQDYYGLLGIENAKGELVFNDIWNFYLEYAGDQYVPAEADSLLEVVNKNEQWNGRLSDACQALNQIIYEYSDMRSSHNYLENYSEGNSNLTYLYVDKKNKKVYTNKKTYGKYSEYKKSLEKIADEDNFILIQPKIADSSSNIRGVLKELSLWQHMVENYGPLPEDSYDFAFGLSVDNKFPIADELKENNDNFYENAKWVRPVLAAGIIALVLFIAILVWLTMVAGRRPEDEKLYLNQFDHWFTEIAAGAVIGLWMLVIAFGINVGAVNEEKLIYVGAGILACGTTFLFLIGYLSLVRRIKAKTLWKRSFLRWFLGFCKRTWVKLSAFSQEISQNARSEVKMILIFGGFLFLQFIMMAMVWSGGGFLVLLLLAMDGAAFVYFVKRAVGRQQILEGLKKISGGELNYKIPTEKLLGEQKTIAEYVNHIGEGLDAAVENSVKNERMKTELITNVSHDIKTPLTSIINYIDLLKRENLTDPKIRGYLDILDAKSQRLKILTEDVVEASKISTGNITLVCTNLDLVEMVNQVLGEFQEKMQQKNLELVVKLPEEPVMIYADGRRMWRVLANIFNNTAKYAMEGTRVYVDLKEEAENAIFYMKNISAAPLNFSADELTERFIRGDVARSTEGSGLGLSIAKNLTELQGGEFQIYLDGDLFKIMIRFSRVL